MLCNKVSLNNKLDFEADVGLWFTLWAFVLPFEFWQLIVFCDLAFKFSKLNGQYRSIHCASQNTETVIQTFRQPTAAFISE